MMATDIPTDHATPSVTIGRIYVRSTAVRAKSRNQLIRNTIKHWLHQRYVALTT